MMTERPLLAAALIPIHRPAELDLSAASLWLDRLLGVLNDRPVQHLQASAEQGVMHLIAAWCAQGHGIWVDISPEQEQDPVVWGNALAQALHQATGLDLAGRGVTYHHALGLMTEYHAVFGPFRVVLSGADLAPQLARELLLLADLGSQVLLVSDPSAQAMPGVPLTLGPADLALRPAELAQLGQAFGLEPAAMQALSAPLQHAFELVWTRLHTRAGKLVPLRPGPDRPRYPPGQEPRLPPQVLMDALTRRGQHLEALEIAVALRLEPLADRLEAAGWQAVSEGRHRRLWSLLRSLEASQRDERALFWMLTAAIRLNLAQEVREEIQVRLQLGTLPDLRALAASVYADQTEYLHEAHAALEAARTPITLMHAAYTAMFPHAPDLTAGVTLAREAVALAQSQSHPHLMINAANVLTNLLIRLGEYREATHWADWAAQQLQQHAINDHYLWLNVACNRIDLQLILGQAAGLGDLIEQIEAQDLEGFNQTTQFYLFQYALVSGKPERALELAQLQASQTQGDLRQHSIAQQYVVMALLQLGETRRGLDVAERAYTPAPHLRVNQLTLGRVLAQVDPERALPLLCAAEAQYLDTSYLSYVAICQAYRALALTRLDREAEAVQLASQAQAFFKNVPDQGLGCFVQPVALFVPLLRPAAHDTVPNLLELRVLGDIHVRMRGQPLTLPPRALDILVTLALSPEGLTGEQLLLAVYGDEGQMGNLKANISKLRRRVPVASQPYRLDLPVQLDALTMRAALATGDWRAALNLYQGPLLPGSEAPAILEWRSQFEEELRQVLLNVRDGEGLYQLGTQLQDLELLEAAAATLTPQDPRYPLLLSHIRRLEREYG